jgi:hypothetical protein
MISIGQAAQNVVDHLARILELRDCIARLPAEPPRDVPPARWRILLDDSRRFFADDPGWGLLALDCGWEPYQLLGANRTKPFARIDQQGLLWLVGKSELEDLGLGYCVLRTRTGSRSTYRTRPLPLDEICLPWEFA